MTVHRVVLLLLLLPILAVGVVFWFLLPGSVAGLAYSPSELTRHVILQPAYWSGRQATVKGYISTLCSGQECANGIRLSDHPESTAESKHDSFAIIVTAQPESGWHHTLRRLLPGMAAPFPENQRIGDRVTLTGNVRSLPTGQRPLVLAPSTL